MGILEMDFEWIFEAPLFLINSHSITQCFDDGLEQKIRYLEKELKKSKKEISDAKLHIKQLRSSLKRSENKIKKVESQNYGLKLQIPYYEEELKSCQRNRMGKDFKYSIDKNQPFKINIACKNDFTRESNGKFSYVTNSSDVFTNLMRIFLSLIIWKKNHKVHIFCGLLRIYELNRYSF